MMYILYSSLSPLPLTKCGGGEGVPHCLPVPPLDAVWWRVEIDVAAEARSADSDQNHQILFEKISCMT
jgi:hypothetical protein